MPFGQIIFLIASITKINEPVCGKTNNLAFRPGLTQTSLCKHRKIARSFKFWILEEEGFYYLCSGNKGADHVCVFVFAYANCCFSHAAAQIKKSSKNWKKIFNN